MMNHYQLAPQPSSTQGFNLIELLIVLAIVLICSGLALSSLQPTQAETRATLYLRQLARDIVYLRSYSISQSIPVTLCPLERGRCINDWTKPVKIFTDHNLNLVLGGNDRLLKVIDEVPPADTFSYPRAGITFRPDGSINGLQSGTFRYCPVTKDSIFSKGLVLSQAGRSRFKDKDISCVE